MELSSIGIIGAGTIGVSVAVDIVINKLDCVLVDNSQHNLSVAKKDIGKILKCFPLLRNDIKFNDVGEVLDRIKFTTNIEEVKDCDFIVENVTENWDIKKKVYHDLDQICRPDVCFGMNTSCTSITLASGNIKRSTQIVGVHFMNPVYLKSTVEAIKGHHTSQKTIEVLDSLLQKLGKKYIMVNDFPGFVSNRISHLFMNEAAFVIQDRVADPVQVDTIFKKCFGHSMGPLETADLIGLDTVVNSLDTLYESYQDPKFRCSPLLRKMVYAGELGRKTGKGFYDYPNTIL